MKSLHSHAFSLTELLVALAVVALVAAIIIPRYVNLQSQAQDVVAQQMAGQLNSVYADWKASGGTIIPTPNASLLLYVLSGQADPISPTTGITYNGATVTETGAASSVRIGLPAGTSIDPASGSNGVPTSTGGSSPMLIVYSSAQDSFAAIPASSISWQQVGSFLADCPYNYTPIPIAVSYNGITYGTLSWSQYNASGSFYGFDGTSYYRADYSPANPVGTIESPSPHYVVAHAPSGYARYKFMGRPVDATWNVTVYKGVKSH